MCTVQKERHREEMNTVSSTSSEEHPVNYINLYKGGCTDNNASDNEVLEPRRPLQSRSHYKSMGNISEAYNNNRLTNSEEYSHRMANSISNVDIRMHGQTADKFVTLRVPIVGYEVMEERARFTIYKLKVEDEQRSTSWLVFRRYTDFVRLYGRIQREVPAARLPLPGKRWFRDNFEPAFLEDRVRGLQMFVNAVLGKLPNHPAVREFFCLDEPPQGLCYQPEVQAVYGALEDSITALKTQLKQKDANIQHLQKRLQQLELDRKSCPTCSTNTNPSTTVRHLTTKAPEATPAQAILCSKVEHTCTGIKLALKRGSRNIDAWR